MSKSVLSYCFTAIAFVTLTSCDDEFDDPIPARFANIQLSNDDIYLYNAGSPNGVRLDPLLNDSIKVDVSVSYTTPEHGSITFIQNEGWFYKPDNGFFGVDNINYTVCHKDDCVSASIRMFVEEPIDPESCSFEINGEAVETQKDQPIAIRIFTNDIVCAYQGSSLSSPEKGKFQSFSYSGSYKNIVYVYHPPKGFVGTDRFMYKIFTSDGDLEAYCEITVK